MPKIDRDGVNIHYEVHGSGPPLILTHGYSSTSAMWQGQIEALSKNHKLVLWDMRGHGQSDYPDDAAAYSEALTVGDIEALLDEVGAPKAVVGGLSLGGYMSLAFYRAHPERVGALLIIDTGPGFKKDDARDAWNKRAHDTADRFAREGLSVLKSASRERSTVSHRDATGLARAARGMLTQRDARVIESLPWIKVPSLVVVGADDAPFLAASDYMAAKIRGAKKIVVAAAGHAVNIDQPQAFIEAVLPFLDGLARWDQTSRHVQPSTTDGTTVGQDIKLTASDGFQSGGYRADPTGAPKGAIVVIQEIFGVNHHIRAICDRLASAGYVAIAPSIFDRIEPNFTSGYSPDEIAVARKFVANPDWAAMLLETQAAIDAVENVGPVGIIGFCLGGSIAYAAATKLSGLSAAVGYYGGAVVRFADDKPKVPTQLHFGEQDTGIPLADVEAIKAKRPDVEVFVYPGAQHGFHCDERASYDKASSEIAWPRSLDFFSRHLKK